jgi:hypothetical protein
MIFKNDNSKFDTLLKIFVWYNCSVYNITNGVDVQTFDVIPDSSYEVLEMYVSERNAQSTYYEFMICAILCLKSEEYIGHKYHISSWYILLVMNQNIVHTCCMLSSG